MAIRGIGIEGVASEIGAIGRTEFVVDRGELVRSLQRRFQASVEEAERAIDQAKEVNVVTESNGKISLADRIKDTGKTQARIKVRGKTEKRVSPEVVSEMLGAEEGAPNRRDLVRRLSEIRNVAVAAGDVPVSDKELDDELSSLRRGDSSKGLEECILDLVKNGTSTTMSIVAKIKSEVPDISESAIRCMVWRLVDRGQLFLTTDREFNLTGDCT